MSIRLRKLEPADLPFLYHWENDASVWADSDTHNPLSKQDLRDYIESTTGDIYRDGQLRLIIEQVAPSSEADLALSGGTTGDLAAVETVGCIDLFDFDPRNRKAAMGLYIAPEARHHGAGYEAVKQMEQYAFTCLNLRLLYVVIREQNAACIALYRRLGYQEIAHLPQWTIEGDAVVFAKYSL